MRNLQQQQVVETAIDQKCMKRTPIDSNFQPKDYNDKQWLAKLGYLWLLEPYAKSFRQASEDPLVFVQGFPKRVILIYVHRLQSSVYETVMVSWFFLSSITPIPQIKSIWTLPFTTAPMARRPGSNSTPTPPPTQQDTPLWPYSASQPSFTSSSCSLTAQPTSSRSS